MKELLLLAAVVACTSARPIKGPDGSESFLISCPKMSDCYEKATEVCGRYKIVDKTVTTSGANGNSGSSIDLLVRCEN
jgi:hypothetical protein